jgi:hypothetical protein
MEQAPSFQQVGLHRPGDGLGKATELSPGYAPAPYWYACVLVTEGREAEARDPPGP